MALYRLTLRTISRGRGELAVAGAAYIAGERLYLEREDTTWDFTWRAKKDLVHKELVGNQGWSREEVWNEAEWAEKRKDGVTAREILIALPRELPEAKQIDLAREMSVYLNNRYGVVVDFAVHNPSLSKDAVPENPHAHLMFTTRVMGPDGLGEKTRLLDARKTGGKETRLIRSYFRSVQNEFLEREGVAARVDERSYVDQGLARLPGKHLGRQLWNLEREGTRTVVGDYNRTVGLVNRAWKAVGHHPELKQWDWNEVARTFSDEHGWEISKAAKHQADEMLLTEKAITANPAVMSPGILGELRAELRELARLQEVLKPCYTLVAQLKSKRFGFERDAREPELGR